MTSAPFIIKAFFRFLIFGVFSIFGTFNSTFAQSFGDVNQNPAFRLVWADEFEENGLPADDNWHFQTQWIIPEVGWANDEKQHYTDRIDNAMVVEGVLKIIAKKETFTDSQGTKSYTSARLNSKFAFTYGFVEVRAKLPDGRGTWPAIWTLGTNINETGGYWNDGANKISWPFCGEIDIMEQFGADKATIHGTVHHGQESGGTSNTASTPLSTSTTEFHNYQILWTEELIHFLVDGQIYYTYNPTSKYGGARNALNWPFFEPQYLILNIAMGGVLGGEIDPEFTESTMEIDYVRVYEIVDLEAEQDATLSEIKVDGTLLNGFSPDKLEYTVTVSPGVTTIPDVDYSLSNQDATVEETKASQVPGETTLLVTAKDGSTQNQYVIRFEAQVLGISDDHIKVYPNPAENTLTISMTDQMVLTTMNTVKILNISGMEHMIEVKSVGPNLMLNLEPLPPGVYILRLAGIENQIKLIRR